MNANHNSPRLPLQALAGGAHSPGGRPAPGGFTLRFQTSCHRNPSLDDARTTFRALSSRSVVLVADDENLRVSFREQSGFPLDYKHLLVELRRAARAVEAHVVVACITHEQHERAEALGRLGYHVHRIPRLNVDVAVGYTVGRLSARHDANEATWVVATGDGELGLCVAGALHQSLRSPRIMTLSVPHSTAYALKQCPLISANLYLTSDLAHRPSHSVETLST